MAVSTRAKNATNQILLHFGLRLDTLTAERTEAERLARLAERRQFAGPKFPLLPGLEAFDAKQIVSAYRELAGDVGRLMQGAAAPGLYDPTNDFYKSPDAQILYLMVRSLRPRVIVEVGSGNSTRIIRQAISDGAIAVEHIAIDPQPRHDIRAMVDTMHLERFEEIDGLQIMAKLGRGDVLFIDSSHEVRIANDVALLFSVVLPALAAGVVVHVHDIYLPFDYPQVVATRFPAWGEQYLLQAHLAARKQEIIWPGYFVQQCRPEVVRELPFLKSGIACSFWYRAAEV